MRRVVRVLLAASAAAVAFTSIASAADLAARARPVAVAQPYLWNGFYIGGNIGYGISDDPSTITTTAGPSLLPIAALGSPLYGSPQNFNLASRGWNGGVQAGYNLQFSPNWVVGFETDFQGADQRDRQNCIVPCGTLVPINATPGALIFPVNFSDDSVEHRLRWFGTVRGRFGYATGTALLYVTGGLAYANIERNASVAGTTLVGGTTIFNTFAGAYSSNSIRTGGTIGAGLEAQLGGGFSVKAEYLYLDFGNISDTFNTTFTTSVIGQTGVAATRTFSSDIREHVFRIGVNYQFGNYYAPVVTK
jgi:outer membrane immunogenic protein